MSEISGSDEVREVGAELVVAIVVETPDGGLLDRSVHPLNVAVGPRMVGLREAMLNAVGFAVMSKRMGLE